MLGLVVKRLTFFQIRGGGSVIQKTFLAEI
jgi:hypothetical protein